MEQQVIARRVEVVVGSVVVEDEVGVMDEAEEAAAVLQGGICKSKARKGQQMPSQRLIRHQLLLRSLRPNLGEGVGRG